MTHPRRTTKAHRAIDNSELTHTDLAAVVEALTGEPLDQTDPATPQPHVNAALTNDPS
ncbi:hypothetical protein [Rhodococcus pyridinivorans]|uniref:hypothetical protein n=1 Tax=Rhodococcus pyridinivorans TaxID=103816 RepID=UPI000A9842A7|nr:hypothetical protein [Rhodococcus pyridinivorans]